MAQRTLERWLMAAGGILLGFGVVMAVAGDAEIFRNSFGLLIDPAFWPRGVPPEAARFQAWVYGAWGGTVAGFGMLIALIARPALSGGNRRLRTGALAALTVWFVVDTGASLTFGVWGNVVAVNLPVYLAIALPLAIGGRARRGAKKIR
jgi:hypothetical protein